MLREQLKKTLDETEAELKALDDKLSKLRPIQSRRDHLHQLAAQIRFILEMDTTGGEPATDTTKATRAIWLAARDVLEQSKVPMSPGEIAEILRGLGYKQLEGRPGKETVRSLLVKKKETFTKLSDGRFELNKPT